MSEPRVITTTRRVIYGDTDAMGVVYYGNYMRFLEEGRVEYLRTRGKAYAEIEAAGFYVPVVEVNFKYKASARYDDEVEIATSLSLGGASITFNYRLTRRSDGAMLGKGWTRHACVDKKTGKAVRLPPVVLDVLKE